MASAALAALYQSSGGSSWSGPRDSWLGDSLCDYAGVNCAYADTGHACEDAAAQAGCDVDSVELWTYGLTGSLPTELGKLTSARSIYLGPNSLSGTTPSQLGQLSKLIFLNLRSNDLSGVVPTQLGALNRTLEYVALHQNALSGTMPTQLGRLGAMTGLNVKTNRISGVLPPEMGEMSSLALLVLQNNLFSGQLPPQIGALPLTSCGIDGTNAFECPLPPLPAACATSATSLCGAPRPPPPSAPSPPPSPPPSPIRPPASPPSSGPSEDSAALAVSIVLVLMLVCLCVVMFGCRLASKRQMRFAFRRPEPRGQSGGASAGARRLPFASEPTSPPKFRAVVVGDLSTPRRVPRLPHESTILAPMDMPTPRGEPGPGGAAAAAANEGPGALAGLACGRQSSAASSASASSDLAETADAGPAEQRARAVTQTRVEKQWAELPSEMPSQLLLDELVAEMLRETEEGDEASSKILGFPNTIKWQLVQAHARNRSPEAANQDAGAGARAKAARDFGRESLLGPGAPIVPIVPPGQRSPRVLKVGQVPWLEMGASSPAMTMAQVNEKVAAAEAAVAAVATNAREAEARRASPL